MEPGNRISHIFFVPSSHKVAVSGGQVAAVAYTYENWATQMTKTAAIIMELRSEVFSQITQNFFSSSKLSQLIGSSSVANRELV